MAGCDFILTVVFVSVAITVGVFSNFFPTASTSPAAMIDAGGVFLHFSSTVSSTYDAAELVVGVPSFFLLKTSVFASVDTVTSGLVDFRILVEFLSIGVGFFFFDFSAKPLPNFLF